MTLNRENARKITTKAFICIAFVFFLFFTGTKGYSAIFDAKTTVFTVICLAYIAISLVLGVSKRGFSIAEIFALAYLLISALSAVLSPYFPTTVFGMSRYEGLFTIALYILVFVFVSQSEVDLGFFIPFVSTVMICQSAVVILQLLSVNFLWLYPEGTDYYIAREIYNGAFISTVGNADIASAFFALATPMLWVAFFLKKHRALTFISGTLSLFCLCSMSVSAGVVAVISTVAILPLVLLPEKRKLVFLCLLIVGVVALLLIYFLPLTDGTLFELQSIMKGEIDADFGSGRIHIWSEVFKNLKIFFGTGPDTMLASDLSPFYEVEDGREIIRRIDVAHNDYLNILFHQGIFALVAYIGMLVTLFCKWYKNGRANPLVALLGAGVFGYSVQVFFSFSACSSALFFWITLGLLNGGNAVPKTAEEQRREIKAAMEKAKNTETVWKEIPKFNPTLEGYEHIKAITYDGVEYKGKKTKVFAYLGFPRGASEENPVPAVVLVHGNGGHPYAEWVRLWNERGYAAIAMDTTGYFPSRVNSGITETKSEVSGYVYGLTEDFAEEGYINAPDRACPAEYTEVQDQWQYQGLSQVILAGNLIRGDARVSSLGIMGVSWGGIMTSQVIGYDNRFSFAISVYGTAYIGDETRAFPPFENAYVDALWAAERNLDNATMPILWLAYNDDNCFGISSYVKSYLHTAPLNEKTTLVMLGDWGHSHDTAWSEPHTYAFADWITRDGKGFITFATQPAGREINCRINIPEGIERLTAVVNYIESPMSYSNYDKFGIGSYIYLDQKWQSSRSWLKVSKRKGVVTGNIPERAKGYYIQLEYAVNETVCHTSSVFVSLK